MFLNIALILSQSVQTFLLEWPGLVATLNRM